MQDTGAIPTTVIVDLGYCGVDADNDGVRKVHRGKYKKLSAQERKPLKHRQTIEPIIGHLKAEHCINRCHLTGELGERLHAVLCVEGYNIKKLQNRIEKKGVAFVQRFSLRLRWALAISMAALHCCHTALSECHNPSAHAAWFGMNKSGATI